MAEINKINIKGVEYDLPSGETSSTGTTMTGYNGNILLSRNCKLGIVHFANGQSLLINDNIEHSLENVTYIEIWGGATREASNIEATYVGSLTDGESTLTYYIWLPTDNNFSLYFVYTPA